MISRIEIKILFALAFRYFNLLSSYYIDKILPKPFELHFEATYRCNCRCVFCKRWKEGLKENLRKKELKYNEIKELINQAYDIGVRILSLSGGEPLMKEGILSLMEYAKNKGLITSVNTNGTLINKENVSKIIDCFDIIIVSIDSLNGDKQDAIRGFKDSFKKALNSVFLLKKNSKNNFIGVSTVLNGENINEILEINAFFMKKGIPTFFQPIHNNPANLFNVSKKEYLDFGLRLEEEYKKIIKNYIYPNRLIKYLYKDYYRKGLDFIMNPMSTINQFVCFAGLYSLFVDPYGDVFPCDICRCWMGNIREKSLREILMSRRSLHIKRQIKNRKCNCWLLCSAPVFINLSKVLNKNNLRSNKFVCPHSKSMENR